ncbi:MAG TPA: ABC transporter permease, partial [Gaiellaceae bacterium]
MSSTSISIQAPSRLRPRALPQVAGDYAAGMYALAKRDLLSLLTYRFRLYTQLAGSLVSVILFYYISRLVTHSRLGSSNDYFAYVVVGLVILTALGSTVTTMPARLHQELVAGTFERLLVSPFGATAAMAGMTIFPFVMALVQGIVTLAFASIVFHMPVHWSTAALALPVALLGTLSFVPFAMLIVAGSLVVKQASVGAGFVMTGISLVGGFFFPPDLLPTWIRWVSQVQPFTPALELLRHLLLGTALTESATLSLIKIGACAGILLPLSIGA